jgi:hypothetical protein
MLISLKKKKSKQNTASFVDFNSVQDKLIYCKKCYRGIKKEEIPEL